ncbi:MAG TPA: DUF1345 domain-containing protein [Methylomirabilota bacterium]|nr:DUF1345 domain-containing protein [Methylomirabilota bacterium]
MARRRGFVLWRIVRHRWRLFLAAGIGVLAALATGFTGWPWSTRLLAAWDAAVVLYLALTVELMVGSNPHKIRSQAGKEDEGAVALLVLTVAAGLWSMVAIFAQLGSATSGGRGGSVALALATVLLSWTFIHTIFALHYAHEFYGEPSRRGGGLQFPGNLKEPDYWDFMYFAFVIGTTFQTSDVDITGKWVRRTVAVHGVVAFLYNVAFLALTVNVAATLLQGGEPR